MKKERKNLSKLVKKKTDTSAGEAAIKQTIEELKVKHETLYTYFCGYKDQKYHKWAVQVSNMADSLREFYLYSNNLLSSQYWKAPIASPPSELPVVEFANAPKPPTTPRSE